MSARPLHPSVHRRPAPRHAASKLRSFLCAATATAALAGHSAAAMPAFEDTLAQRLQACTACHGAEGRAAPDGYYPRIAGKPAGYLYNQLTHFRDGRRPYRLMTRMVDPLSDTYLRDIARHFAALDLPYPPPVRVALSAADAQRGEQLALRGDPALQLPACIQCHGSRLTGMEPATPGLLGLPRDYVNAQIGAWRTGLRQAHAPDCMGLIARRLSPHDVAAVSGWLAQQPLPANAHPAPAPTDPLPMHCGSAWPTGAQP